MQELPASRLSSVDGSLLRIRLFGRMDVRTSTGSEISIIGGKTKALLAILALSDRKPVQRQMLADLLWSHVTRASALASLRQEVHRLKRAFDPFGIMPISVQRHTLTLKPTLSSVDVEKILHGGIDVLRCLPAPDEGLLPELVAVDPDFDKWMDAHRKRVDGHILSLFKSALQQADDPVTMLFYADGLLKRDILNELGWRARLKAYVEQAEWGAAVRGCDALLALFKDRLCGPPGSETMELIREIRARVAADVAFGGFAEKTADFLEVGANSSSWAPTRQGEGVQIGVHRLTTGSSLDKTRILGRVAVGVFSSSLDVQLGPSISALAEQLEVELVRLNTLQVVFRPNQDIALLQQPISQTRHDRVDFRIEGSVCIDHGLHGSSTHPANTYITIRLISCKDDDFVIWADRIRFPQSSEEVARFNRFILWAMQWALLLWEGRGTLHRPVAELSAPRLAARAAHLMISCDSSKWPEMNDLINRAEARDAENEVVLFVKAFFALIGYPGRWQAIPQTERRNLARNLERISAIMRHNPLGAHLVVFARLVLPEDFDQARALAEEGALQDTMGYAALPFGCFYAWRALIAGDTERAAREIREHGHYKSELAVTEIMKPFSALILHACGTHDEAHRIITAYLYTYPRCKFGLLVYLLGVLQAEDSEEARAVCQRIERLSPDVTISGILAQLRYLPLKFREWAAEMLSKSSLPR